MIYKIEFDACDFTANGNVATQSNFPIGLQ